VAVEPIAPMGLDTVRHSTLEDEWIGGSPHLTS
jgi:hypothetical protein